MNELRRWFRSGKSRKKSKSRQQGKKKKKSNVSSRYVSAEEDSPIPMSISQADVSLNYSTIRSNPSKPSSSHIHPFHTKLKTQTLPVNNIHSRTHGSNSNFNVWAASVDNVSMTPSKYGKLRRAPPIPVQGESFTSQSPSSIDISPTKEKIYNQTNTLPLPKNVSPSIHTRSANRSRIENWLQGESSLRKTSGSSTLEHIMDRNQNLSISRDERDLAGLRMKRGQLDLDNESVLTFNSSLVSTSRKSVLGAAVSTWNRFTTMPLETDLNNSIEDDIDSVRSAATFSYPIPRGGTLNSQSSLASRKALGTALLRVRFKQLINGASGEHIEPDKLGEATTPESVDSPVFHRKIKMTNQVADKLRPSSALEGLNSVDSCGETTTSPMSSVEEGNGLVAELSPPVTSKRIRNRVSKQDSQRDTSASEERQRGRESNRSSSNFQLLYEIVEEEDDFNKDKHPSTSSTNDGIIKSSAKDHSKEEMVDSSLQQYFFGEKEKIPISQPEVSFTNEEHISSIRQDTDEINLKCTSEKPDQTVTDQLATVANDSEMLSIQEIIHFDESSTPKNVLKNISEDVHEEISSLVMKETNEDSILIRATPTVIQYEYNSIVVNNVPHSSPMNHCNGVDSNNDYKKESHELSYEPQNDISEMTKGLISEEKQVSRFTKDLEFKEEANSKDSIQHHSEVKDQIYLQNGNSVLLFSECPNLLLHPSLSNQEEEEIKNNDFCEKEKFLKNSSMDIEEEVVHPIELKAVKTSRQRSAPRFFKRNHLSKVYTPAPDSTSLTELVIDSAITFRPNEFCAAQLQEQKETFNNESHSSKIIQGTAREDKMKEEPQIRKLSIRCPLTLDEMLGTMSSIEDDIFDTPKEQEIEESQTVDQGALFSLIAKSKTDEKIDVVSLFTRPDNDEHINNYVSFDPPNSHHSFVNEISHGHKKISSLLSASCPLLNISHDTDEEDRIIHQPWRENVMSISITNT